MKKTIFTLLALMVFIPVAVVYASSYTGPGNRTNISTDVIVRTQCLSTQYEGYNPVWRYRDWDGVYAAPGSATALHWQATYPYAPEHTHCHSGLGGSYGWGEKTISTGSYDPVSTSRTVTCGTPGSAGWCRGGLTLTMNATEPIPGENVRRFDNDNGVMCNPTNAPSISCTVSITQQGTHTSDFWALSTFGDTSTKRSYSWSLDSLAPAMVANTTGSPANGWHTSNVTMSLSATDTTSGVASSTYRWSTNGGGSWVSGNNHTFTADGVYNIIAEVQDIAGNVGDQNITIRLDKIPPTVNPTITGTLNNGWYRFNPTVSAHASDATSGVALVECRQNGGAWSNCTFAPMIGITQDGTHQIQFRVTDNAGHVTTSPVVTLQRDNTEPDLFYPRSPAGGGWKNTDVTVSLSASDAMSGLAPGWPAWRPGSSGAWIPTDSITFTDEGEHQFQVRAEDLAGNGRTIQATPVRIDKTPPTLVTSAPGGWINASGTASATATDATSGVASTNYRVNGGAWQSGTSVSIATEGTHAVDFRAIDNAGNERIRSETVRVDLTPPTVTAHPDPDGMNGWYTSNPVIPLSANDALSGVLSGSLRYRINGAATWTTGSSLSIVEDGTHTVNLQVDDAAGNTGTDSFNVRVDTTPPELSIDVSSAVPVQNGWHVEPVTAGAVASDATSGIDLVEYRVENAVASTARAGRFSPAPQSAWVTGDHLTLTDGDHLVTMRATDVAGNQTVTSERIRVDLTAPSSTFVIVNEPISGETTLTGTSFDAHSGVDVVEYSFDNGLTWETVAHTNGNWAVPFDTTSGPDGEYAILVRATDLSGHRELAPTSLTVTVNNKPPKPLMTESWWIWESGELAVEPGITPLGEIRLQIACGSQPDVKMTFDDLAKLPPEFTWNRRCGDGHLAPPGDYQVTLIACNIYDKCDTALGTIRIPEGQTPTPTPEPTDDPEPAPTPTAAPPSLSAAPPPAPPAEIVEFIAEVIPEAVARLSLWLLPLAGIVGSLAALGVNHARDPRPAAIRKLGSLLARRADE
jgi:hypothetical protein